MTKETKCQLCDKPKRVTIDGLVLCTQHASEYIHQLDYPDTSMHRQQFDKLLGRFEFVKKR